ncbi:MAG TPA: CocE/NonD family hydrolase, partial [Steroidobacteraceae bacterium]|nr:CocE/NonD family hydrolase [Steroidobacteraceae bacterium]
MNLSRLSVAIICGFAFLQFSSMHQASAASAQSAAGQELQEPPAPEVDLQWGLRIPMRDGVQLNGTVYRPHGQTERLPVIFTLTPYIADSYHARAMYFAQHGYVFVLVDVRGRGNSGG